MPPDRDALVVRHLGLVRSVAHRLAQRLPAQVELGDLVGAGVIGLVDAAARYKPSTGVPFEAFARRRVHGAMLDALRDLDWAPRSLRRLRRQLDATVSRLRQELRREPHDDEVAAAMRLSPAGFARAQQQLQALEAGTMRQLDPDAPEDAALLERCLDGGDGPEALVERQELKAHLARALLELPDRERQILALYYQEELTMAEIGQVIGVCESRVSQLRSLALTRLRGSLEEKLLARAA